MVTIHYPQISVLIPKLRTSNTDDIRDELMAFAVEVDNLMDNELRARLGTINSVGNPIVYPLTVNTTPALDPMLQQIANYLLIGKYRLETSNEMNLWVSANEMLQEYLDKKFGWSRDMNYKVVPTLTPSASTGTQGSLITLSGSNFLQFSVIQFSFDGVILATTPSLVTADVNGSFSGVQVAIPTNELVPYTYPITATDSFTPVPNTATANFTVTISLGLAPTSGHAGTQVVSVTGTGFALSSNITMYFDNVLLVTSPGTVTTSVTGTFSCTFTVPGGAVIGSHTVKALDASGNNVSTLFVVN